MDSKVSQCHHSVMSSSDWRQQGDVRRVGRHDLFYIDTGGDKPVLLILHGYPTSSHDNWRALPILAGRYRVIIHDHLGFGFSDKPRDYSRLRPNPTMLAHAMQRQHAYRAGESACRLATSPRVAKRGITNSKALSKL